MTRKWFSLLSLLSIVGLMTLGLSARPVLADHEPSLEMDGNIPNDAAIPGPDWKDFFNVADNGVVTAKETLPAGFGDATFRRDFVLGASGPDRTTYTTGSKDTLSISPGWSCARDNNVNDKTDILNAYATVYRDHVSAEQILYFALERHSNEGDGNVGFWFLQDDNVACQAPATGPSTLAFTGNHTNGDLLVVSEFSNGGSVASVKVYRWNGTDNGGSLGATPIATGGECVDNTLGANLACAKVNTTDQDPPWPAEDKDGGNLDTSEFYEGAINLTQLNPNICVSKYSAITRSSTSLTASIFDFSLGNIDTCSAAIEITPDAVNEVRDPHTFDVNVTQSLGGAPTPATVGHVDVTLTASNGAAVLINAALSTCDDAGDNLDADGHCSITFKSNTAGIITGHAVATVIVGGKQLTVATDGQAPNSDDAVKRFVDARIAIGPDATNEIGKSHTFTVDVDQNDGLATGGDGVDGFGPAKNGHVDFTLTDAGGAVKQIDADLSTCDNLGDNLDADGQCTITFKSNTAGTVTGAAEVTLLVGGVSLERETDDANGNSGDTVKRFVDARIAISPDDINGIRESHTFTVDVDQNDGLATGGDGVDGFGPASIGHVDVTLTNASGAVYVINAALSTCDNLGDNLDADGQCTITFKSNTAGTVTGHAKVTLDLGLTEPAGGLVVRETDGASGNTGDAVKTFVDGTLRWLKHDQDGALLGGATFEVCRTHNFVSADSSFADIADVCVSVLDDSDADADKTPGEFQRNNQVLGRYTIKETVAPAGYQLDPDTETVELTIADRSNVTNPPIFVNVRLFKMIVITCNQSTNELVVSEVTLDTNGAADGGVVTLDTVGPSAAASELCQIEGGTSKYFTDLRQDTYTPTVVLPKQVPQ